MRAPPWGRAFFKLNLRIWGLMSDFQGRDVLSIRELTKSDIQLVLKTAKKMVPVAVPGWKDSRHVVLRAVHPDPPFVRECDGPPGRPRPRLQRNRGDLRPKGRDPRRYDPDGRGLQRRHRATASAGR